MIWKCPANAGHTLRLANASEVREHHAAGIAYNKDDVLTIFKRPKPAHKLHFRIPQRTAAVMGHTRLTTQGDQKFNYNNHPFRGHAATDFALAHNGVLYNDNQLVRKNDRVMITRAPILNVISISITGGYYGTPQS